MNHMSTRVRVPIELDNPAIERIEALCVKCGLCTKVCRDYVGVLDHYDLERAGGVALCTHCGQCTTVCPTASIVEKSEVEALKNALADKEKVLVMTASPAVRVALGEAFGGNAGDFVEGKMVALLRKLGANYVLDTNFAADLTVVEEATEFLERFTKGRAPLPLFTSCCPAWVKYCEVFHPEMLPHLSSAKSPIAMQGATIKTYFAKKIGVDPAKIINVAVTPCTAKKFEVRREEMNAAGRSIGNPAMRDTDFVITTRELAKWAKEEKIDFAALEESAFDNPLGLSSGAGVIFGVTGGVMEAALRTAAFYLTGKNVEGDFLKFVSPDGKEDFREAEVTLAGRTLHVAVIYGTNRAGKVIEEIKRGERHYDFIEVMSCPEGCIGGGGQPKASYGKEKATLANRAAALRARDKALPLRFSHENPEIKAVYEEFYGAPLSEKAKSLLHTSYVDRSALLGKDCKKVPQEKESVQEVISPAKPKEGGKKRFRCTLCGHTYEAEELPADYKCPLCGAAASAFEEI